jgi:hypothetical protein
LTFSWTLANAAAPGDVGAGVFFLHPLLAKKEFKKLFDARPTEFFVLIGEESFADSAHFVERGVGFFQFRFGCHVIDIY